MKTVYLDNNATTAIAPEASAAMRPFFEEQYYNPSSAYDAAAQVSHALREARREVASLFGAIDPQEIYFTGSATESINWALFGAVRANPKRRHIITSSVEHPAVLEVCRELERLGCNVTWLPVDRHGQLNTQDFVRALQPDTLMVSLMHANNETGVIFPVDELARITKETDPTILVHSDATQSVGKLPIDLSGTFRHVDLLSFSGHKLHAPKGVGVLFMRRGTAVRPFLIGGHQERGQRAGTENMPYIVALAAACRLAKGNGQEHEEQLALRDRLENGLLERIPMIEINGKGAERLPNTLNLGVHYIEGESMLYQLSSLGICASSGSACTSGSLEASHVLKAMNVPFTTLHGSIRFSLGRYNTVEDIDRVLEVFPDIVARLRRLSPYWDNEKNQPRPGKQFVGDHV